jgi:hypothetical protein
MGVCFFIPYLGAAAIQTGISAGACRAEKAARGFRRASHEATIGFRSDYDFSAQVDFANGAHCPQLPLVVAVD